MAEREVWVPGRVTSNPGWLVQVDVQGYKLMFNCDLIRPRDNGAEPVNTGATEYERRLIARADAMAQSEDVRRIAGTLQDLASALAARAVGAPPKDNGGIKEVYATARKLADSMNDKRVETLRAACRLALAWCEESEIVDWQTINILRAALAETEKP